MKTFNNAATDLRGGWQPSLSLELALAEVLDAPATPAPQAAVAVQQKSQPAITASPSVGGTEGGTALATTNKDESQTWQPAEKSSVDAGDIIKAWKRMSAALPKNQANLSALMNSVKMIDVQGQTLVLGLASDVLVSKINQPDQIELIQRLIEDEFGVELNVKCVVTTAKGKIPPDISQDGMVAAAIRHGGQIVDM
jgi:hypothetical protein